MGIVMPATLISPHSSPAPWPLPAGMRSTRALRAVTQLFDERQGLALSEADVEAMLADRQVAVNKVTIYRLLDRLAAAGLLQRQVDGQRITRYRRLAPAASAPAAGVPHFECDDCHRQFTLEQGAAPVQDALQQVLAALASAGHEHLAVDVAVHGRCAGCAHPGQAPGQGAHA